jgi:hypothetical protein
MILPLVIKELLKLAILLRIFENYPLSHVQHW